MNTDGRIINFYRELDQINQSIKKQYMSDIYKKLGVEQYLVKSMPLVLKPFNTWYHDPKYILPGISAIDFDDWAQRKFALSMLLIETIVGKVIDNLDEIVFNSDDSIQFKI